MIKILPYKASSEAHDVKIDVNVSVTKGFDLMLRHQEYFSATKSTSGQAPPFILRRIVHYWHLHRQELKIG